MQASNKDTIVTFILIIIVFVLGLAIGGLATSRYLRAEAVINGHAEWIPNEYGETTFVWKK